MGGDLSLNFPLFYGHTTPTSKQHQALVPSIFAPLIWAACVPCPLMPRVLDARSSYCLSRQRCWPRGHGDLKIFFTCGRGGGVNRAPQKLGGGGFREKGSIDRHH